MAGADSFSWARYRAAEHYLYALKPYWSRFGGRMKVVPVLESAPPGEQWGGMMAVDGDLNLYADSVFVNTAPLHVVSGAIERCLQRSARDVWRRFSWMKQSDRIKYGDICLDLEISSSVIRDSAQMTMDEVRSLLSSSMVFSDRQLDQWQVTDLPGLDERHWDPRKLDLPLGLSAEDYFGLITKQDDEPESQEQEQEQEQEQDAPEADPDADEPDNLGDTSGEDDDPQHEDSQADDDSQPSDTPDQSQSDDQDDEQSDDPSSDEPAEPESSSDSDSDSAEDGDGEDSAGSAESGEPGDPSSEQSKDQGLAGKIAEMRSDPSLQWWADETRTVDRLRQDAQNEGAVDGDGLTEELDRDVALKELAEDVLEGAKNPSMVYGIRPGDELVEIANMELRRLSVHWTTILSRMVSRSAQSAKIRGASDLSYSVRNPNQPPLGPVMMGLHDYAPSLTVLIDCSYSMTAFLTESMSAFRDIIDANRNMFGQRITWITADTKVRDVGAALSLDPNTLNRARKTSGGTVLREVIEDIYHGRFRWNGTRYPIPDVLVVVTDCAFEWPWRRVRPPSRPIMVTCSVVPYRYASRNLPNWIVERRNFVYAMEE